MNEFTYENQGTNTYLVYALNGDDYLDTMSLGMITNNKIPGIANTVFMQSDNQKFIKYNVSSKVSARQFFTGAVNRRRLLGVFKGIVDAMLSAEEYMIDHNMILLDLDYIFADVSTCETVLICVPVLGDDLKQTDFSKFFKEIMFSTQFDQTENCDYVARIINYLNSTPQFSLVDFQELLINVEMGSGAAAMGVQSRTVVHEQPKAPQPVVHQAPPVQQPVNVQPPVAQPYVPPVQMPVNTANNNIKMPEQPVAQKVNQGTTQSEKPMSMFYLLQHYNKENAAAYKAQKDAKKAEKGQKVSEPQKGKKEKKEKKSKKGNDMIAPPPMKVPGAPGTLPPNFAVPGQPVMPPPNAEPLSKPVQQVPPVRQVPPVQQVPPTPKPTQPQMPVYTTSGVMGVPSAGFGETTVLSAVTFGETTVLSGELAPVVRNPYLIRAKNNEKILVNKPVFRIGKERSYVDYFIGDNPAISRSHANVITREGQYFVIDTNSTNHTFVNGKMIQSNEEVLISSGDKIKLGNEDFEFTLS